MNFKNVLKNGTFCLDLKGETKEQVIQELIDAMVAEGKITDKKAALDAVLERERKMSTGMQYGVAIPHGKTGTVEDMVVAFGLKRDGMDFKAIDGQPSRIFVMTISSNLRTGPHIQYLSEISKQLNRESIRSRLLEAQTAEEVIDILIG